MSTSLVCITEGVSGEETCWTSTLEGATVISLPTTVPLSAANPEDGNPRATTSSQSSTQNNGKVGQSSTAGISTAEATVTPTISPASPLPAVSSGDGSRGVSKGAVAGIAIATAIIGAAIASLVAFFFFKRRRRSSGHPYSSSTPEFRQHLNVKDTPYVQVSQNAAPPSAIAAAVPPAKRDLGLANLSNSSDFLAEVLAPTADEQTVKSKVAALFNQIQQHVDCYYRDVHATMTPTMQSDLTRFGSDLIEVLENSSVPTVAIKHALAGYILSIVSPEAEDQATLFPAEIAGLKENERKTNTPEDQAAYILYKRLAAHLHNPTSASLQSRQSDIREAAEHFALTFFPWANPAYHDQEKDEHLVQVIRSALEVSIWLYGQPYLYEFVWEGVGRRGTVVAPGLARLTDKKGRMLERAQILLEPCVASS